MSIWNRMNEITSGKIKEKDKELSTKRIAKHGNIIRGVITNLVMGNEEKGKKGGYGFISSEQLPFERIFFHWSGLRQDTLRFPDLKKRMKVEFQLQHDPYDGYRAIKIIVIQ